MSVAGAIADAVVTAVGALGLTGATVVRRKKPSLPQGKDPVEIVVTVGDTTQVEPMTARKDFVTRSVAVAVVTGGGKKLGDDDTFRGWLEQIRAAVNQPATFAAVAQFDEVNVGKESPYDRAALDKDLNYGVELFTVRTREARN